jgi:hypothetical protein
MGITVVISRYNENVEWVNQLQNVNIIVFNKGEPFSLSPPHIKIIPLENVGKEGHTFYHYIYENYDFLNAFSNDCSNDYTFFLQGNPFDHCKDIVERINHFHMNKTDFDFLSDSIHLITLSQDIMIDDYDKEYKIPNRLVYNYIFDVYNLDDIRYYFGVGGQFVVSNSKIKSNPRELYLRIIKILSRTKMPIEGYVIERFPSLVFDSEKGI